MKRLRFEVDAEILEETNSGDQRNPLITVAKFPFCDDALNENGQGVEAEDFDQIVQSAIGMPVKMAYKSNGPDGHAGSIPIGHIQKMEKETMPNGVNRLIATATLWEKEFPKEIKYLKDSYAANTPARVSYELLYEDSAQKNGGEWLKNIITRAVTFVRNPAYGDRTALMAIASDESLDDETMIASIQELATGWASNNTAKGGRNVELEEALKELEKVRKDFETANAEVARLTGELETAGTQLAEATAKNTELEGKIAEAETEKLRATRTAKMVEAGFELESDAEKAAKREEFWLSMSEDQFALYLEDFSNLAKKTIKSSVAEKKGLPNGRQERIGIPRTQAVASKTVTDIKESFKNLSPRNISTEE